MFTYLPIYKIINIFTFGFNTLTTVCYCLDQTSDLMIRCTDDDEKRISMVALVVEGAVGDEDVCGRSLLLRLALLRANHDQGQLSCRLPDLLLLDDLFGVCGAVFGALVVAGLRLLYVVDLVAVVVRAAVHVLVLVLALCDGPTREDVEASLGLGYQVAVLVLLETHILLFYLFLGGLVALVDRLGVHSTIESLRGQHFIELFLPLSVDVHLR